MGNKLPGLSPAKHGRTEALPPLSITLSLLKDTTHGTKPDPLD